MWPSFRKCAFGELASESGEQACYSRRRYHEPRRSKDVTERQRAEQQPEKDGVRHPRVPDDCRNHDASGYDRDPGAGDSGSKLVRACIVPREGLQKGQNQSEYGHAHHETQRKGSSASQDVGGASHGSGFSAQLNAIVRLLMRVGCSPAVQRQSLIWASLRCTLYAIGS